MKTMPQPTHVTIESQKCFWLQKLIVIEKNLAIFSINMTILISYATWTLNGDGLTLAFFSYDQLILSSIKKADSGPDSVKAESESSSPTWSSRRVLNWVWLSPI